MFCFDMYLVGYTCSNGGRWSCRVSILVKWLSSKFHENNWSSFWVRRSVQAHGCGKVNVTFLQTFIANIPKIFSVFLYIFSRNFVCIGKLSIHFLAMPELWRKSSVGTASLLLSICYNFSIWLGICTDLSSLHDTWPYPKWTWAHWADCHQVRFYSGVVHQVFLISLCMFAARMVVIHKAVTRNLMQIASIYVTNLTLCY